MIWLGMILVCIFGGLGMATGITVLTDASHWLGQRRRDRIRRRSRLGLPGDRIARFGGRR